MAWFAIASGLMVLVGAFYLSDILKVRLKPERTAHGLFGHSGVVAFAALVQLGMVRYYMLDLKR